MTEKNNTLVGSELNSLCRSILLSYKELLRKVQTQCDDEEIDEALRISDEAFENMLQHIKSFNTENDKKNQETQIKIQQLIYTLKDMNTQCLEISQTSSDKETLALFTQQQQKEFTEVVKMVITLCQGFYANYYNVQEVQVNGGGFSFVSPVTSPREESPSPFEGRSRRKTIDSSVYDARKRSQSQQTRQEKLPALSHSMVPSVRQSMFLSYPPPPPVGSLSLPESALQQPKYHSRNVGESPKKRSTKDRDISQTISPRPNRVLPLRSHTPTRRRTEELQDILDTTPRYSDMDRPADTEEMGDPYVLKSSPSPKSARSTTRRKDHPGEFSTSPKSPSITPRRKVKGLDPKEEFRRGRRVDVPPPETLREGDPKAPPMELLGLRNIISDNKNSAPPSPAGRNPLPVKNEKRLSQRATVEPAESSSSERVDDENRVFYSDPLESSDTILPKEKMYSATNIHGPLLEEKEFNSMVPEYQGTPASEHSDSGSTEDEKKSEEVLPRARSFTSTKSSLITSRVDGVEDTLRRDDSTPQADYVETFDVYEVGNSVALLVQELFPYHWSSTPPEEQQSFLEDIHECFLQEFPRRALFFPPMKSPRPRSVGPGGDGIKRSVTVSRKKSKREDKRDPKIKSQKNSKGKNKWGGTIKGKKKRVFDVELLEFSNIIPHDLIAKAICKEVMNFIKQVSVFIEENKQIYIHSLPPEDKEKRSQYKAKESLRIKKEKEKAKARSDIIVESTKLVIQELRSVSQFFPQSDKSILGTVSSRVRSQIFVELEPKALPIDQNLVMEGFNLLLMKNRLLWSIQFRASRITSGISQLLSALCLSQEDDELGTYHILSLTEAVDTMIRQLLNEVASFVYLVDFELKLSNSSQNPSMKPKLVNAKRTETTSKERTTAEKGILQDHRFESGTISSLVVRVTDGSDNLLRDAFFNAYSFYMSPHMLFDKFKERFRIQKGQPEEAATQQFTQMRVANTILHWLKKDFHNMDPELLASIQNFICTNLQHNFQDIAKRLTAEIENESRFYLKDTTPPQDTLAVYNIIQIAPHQVLLYCQEKTIAEQMTRIDAEIFRSLDRTELVGCRWANDRYRLLTPFVHAMLERNFLISTWVQTWILLQSTINHRKKVIKWLFNVAKHLIELHNYHSFMGIYNGLNAPTITRLGQTWSSLGRKTLEMLELFTKLSNTNTTFQELREITKDGGKNALPFLAVCLRELQHLEDSMDDFETPTQNVGVDGPPATQLVNFKKHSIMTEIMNSLFQYQITWTLEIEKREPFYTFLVCPPVLNEEELYRKSLEQEHNL